MQAPKKKNVYRTGGRVSEGDHLTPLAPYKRKKLMPSSASTVRRSVRSMQEDDQSEKTTFGWRRATNSAVEPSAVAKCVCGGDTFGPGPVPRL